MVKFSKSPEFLHLLVNGWIILENDLDIIYFESLYIQRILYHNKVFAKEKDTTKVKLLSLPDYSYRMNHNFGEIQMQKI